MFHILAVPPWEIGQRAPFLSRLILKACSRCDQKPLELMKECAAGRAVLWVVADENAPVGVCVTRVVKRPGDLAVENIVTGGEGGVKWAGILRDRLRAFRRAEGADVIFIWGRKGWGRVLGLQPMGYLDGKWLFEDYG